MMKLNLFILATILGNALAGTNTTIAPTPLARRPTEGPTYYPTKNPSLSPITPFPTTPPPSTPPPSTPPPSTAEPTTAEPTTYEPTTAEPTTPPPSTPPPSTAEPTTYEPTIEGTPTISKEVTSPPTVGARQRNANKKRNRVQSPTWRA